MLEFKNLVEYIKHSDDRRELEPIKYLVDIRLLIVKAAQLQSKINELKCSERKEKEIAGAEYV